MRTSLVLGIDFGTLSARCILVDAQTGVEMAMSEHRYEHGVIEGTLPGLDAPLPPNAARQDPKDYLSAMKHSVAGVLAQSRVDPADIVAIGIDVTSCTLLPVSSDGNPLCWEEDFRSHPDAWVHLWKDQTAQFEAARMTELASERDETFLTHCGNKIAPDTLYPKVWQIIRRSPEVFHAATRFLEVGDWIVQYLTGTTVGGASAAGYKALWNGAYPEEFLTAVDTDLGRLAREKLATDLIVPGERAGVLSAQAAHALGLVPGITVASANIDAHAAVSGSGVAEPGTMVVVMGTSMCHMLLTEESIPVPGIVGAVQDGIVPGYVGYEAGQPAVGDLFSWFVDNALPGAYEEAARRLGITTYTHLESLADDIAAGESGLIALDWWNGNRSPLANGNLSGMIIGYSLQTRPEHVFKALMESVAFGTREIIRSFETNGIPVNKINACGGIAVNSPTMLQLLADITGRPISVASSPNASALGAAIMAAIAHQGVKGRHQVAETVARMTQAPLKVYEPNHEVQDVYDILYSQYRSLVNHFSATEQSVMDSLRHLKVSQASKRVSLQNATKSISGGFNTR